MQVMRAKVRPFRHVVSFVRLRESGDTHRIRRVANVEQPDQLLAILLVIQHRLIKHHQQIPIRERQRGVGAAAKRRAPVTVANQLRLSAVLHIEQGQAAVAPAAVGGVAGDNRMMKGIALAFRPLRGLPCRLVHPRQPPAPGDLRLARVGQVDSQENVVAKAVNQRGNVGPASADVPDSVDTDAVKRQKGDLSRFIRSGNIKNPQPGAPAPIPYVADRLAHRTGVVNLFVGEAGIGEQIPGVDHQQQIVVRL